MIEDVGAAPLAGRHVGEFSGEQRQRVWIAMAPAQSTEILLLDKPTTYLNPNHQLEVLRLMERLQHAGTTVATMLRDLHLAFRYATHLVSMKNSEIVTQEASRDVMTAGLVGRAFNVPYRIVDDPETGSLLMVPTR